LENQLDVAVTTLESWYETRCNGDWENHNGILIESTDNPGWLVTIRELSISTAQLARIVSRLLLELEAQVQTDGVMVRVFAPKIKDAITAASIVINCSNESQ
jgi:hypothetical protein